MSELNLSKYGISGATEIVRNPSYDMLFAEEMKPELEGYEKGQISELGAVNVMAIVADKLGKPLNELRFKTIKEV